MKKDAIAHPEATVFNFTQEDGPYYFDDDNNRRLESKYKRSGILIRFCNVVARELNKFTEKDSLVLTISGIDDAWHDTQQVVYFLALGREFNQGWVKVDLSSIGATKGLSFRIRSTDVGQWGTNTPTYFALDRLTINPNAITGLPSLTMQPSAAKKLLHQGRILIIRNGITYTLDGNRLSEH